jgi:hypothetical protein
MKRPRAFVVFLTVLVSGFGSFSASAQHPGNGRMPHAQGARSQPPQAKSPGVSQQVPPHIQRQMEEQQRQLLQQQQKEHARMVEMQQQAIQRNHEQHLQRFRDWMRSQGASSGSESLAGVPKDPAAFQQWLKNQKHRKALKKTVDPAFEQYQAFDGSKKHHKPQSSQTPKQAETTTNPPQQNQAEASTPSSNKTGTGVKISDSTSATSSQSTATPPNPTHTAGTTDSKSGGASSAAGSTSASAAGSTSATTKPKTHHLHHEEAAMVVGPGPQRSLLGQDQGIAALLRTVHSSLNQADHDYLGNRVEAMRYIAHALHHLGSSPSATLGGGFGNLPQARSDAILREAALKLKNVDGQLASRSTHDVRHQEARAEVERAIHHLHIALEIR